MLNITTNQDFSIFFKDMNYCKLLHFGICFDSNYMNESIRRFRCKNQIYQWAASHPHIWHWALSGKEKPRVYLIPGLANWDFFFFTRSAFWRTVKCPTSPHRIPCNTKYTQHQRKRAWVTENSQSLIVLKGTNKYKEGKALLRWNRKG